MVWKKEWKPLVVIAGLFAAFFFMPAGLPRFDDALLEAFALARWYAREHVLLCLVPAFFIAGAIAVFVSHASVMKYLGAGANKVVAYGVASVSGSVLAVCSCTVLPLFAGIYRMGAGLGPATTFLYAGPAINVLAIILTARVLGLELGIARTVGAVVFSIVIGLLMHLFFRREEAVRNQAVADLPEQPDDRPLWKTTTYFAAMIAILVFANWGAPEESHGIWYWMFAHKWLLSGLAGIALGVILAAWFRIHRGYLAAVGIATVALAVLFPDRPLIAFSAGVLGLSAIISARNDEAGEWFEQTWGFAKQILPLLLAGVLIAGFLLGRPGHEGMIPSRWISAAVGGNAPAANLFAAVAGAFMYFATLTEIPILQGLLGSGMGKGPALALLLAGPALSLPSILVIRSVMGIKKTAVFVLLVIVMAAVSGMIFGSFF